MEMRKGAAFASLLMILIASLVLVTPTQPASANPDPENHRYWVMPIPRKNPGNVWVNDSIMETPPPDTHWNFTMLPAFSCQNITFSEPWILPGYGQIVNLTVPATSYVGISYTFWSKVPPFWFRFTSSMSEDGYGWVFLDATGDVDCHTVSNNTAAYWRTPSPFAGTKAANHGTLPSPGPDGVAGTADDGFGDGTPDSRGSSILMIPTTMTAEYHTGTAWAFLFSMSWPQVYTTGNASAIVDESDGGPGVKLPSQIDGATHTAVGQPWEFFAGLDHSGWKVEYGHAKWNAYVTYVCAWSLLDISTTLGDYDICFSIIEKMIRDDCVISDINGDEKVTISDIVIAALAFGAEDSNPGPDGKYGTGDDKKVADPNYDARGDFKPTRGKITISDIVAIALDFGASLTPDCIIRP